MTSDDLRREEELELTVGLVWREERVGCPHRDVLRAFLDGSLEPGAMDYLAFHIDECLCPYCGSVLDELREQDANVLREDLLGIKDRLLRSTAVFLRSKPSS
jgi:hypothetical protein